MQTPEGMALQVESKFPALRSNPAWQRFAHGPISLLFDLRVTSSGFLVQSVDGVKAVVDASGFRESAW